MHLNELLSLRAIPMAGVSLGLTRRCPLSCPHCSTNSTNVSEQHPGAIFTNFVDSFSTTNRPEVVSMSGGEAMLRPKLVQSIAERARKVGTRSSCLSGHFFANKDMIPRTIENAIRSLDHFSVSMDIFHEAEVSRDNSFRSLEKILRWGVPVSVHLVGLDNKDPYVRSAIDDIRQTFAEQVPILVNSVSWFGRARIWLETPEEHIAPPRPMPCTMAAWPVVSYDGTVIACGNDDAIDTLPPHLTLGHVAKDSWSTLRQRSQTSSILRAIRLYGPEYLRGKILSQQPSCDGYCDSCLRMQLTSDEGDVLNSVMSKASTRVMESAVSIMHAQGGGESFARHHGISQMSELVKLGAGE